MGWMQRLFGGGGLEEVPWEPPPLDEVQQRATWSEPAVAGIQPEMHFDRLQTRVDADRSNATAVLGLASVQLCLGDIEQGLETMNMAIFHEGNPERVARANRIKATTLDLFRDQPDAAMEHYDACTALAPRYMPVKVYLAEIAYRNGDKRKLKKLFEQMLRAGLKGALGDAEAALHSDDHEGAVEALHIAHRVSLLQCIAEASALR